MNDSRSILPKGTTIALESGNTYIITGAPIGWGGGSIIYPAERQILQDGSWVSDGFSYALKECFPLSLEHKYVRSQRGEICEADSGSSEDAYLLQAKRLQFAEGNLSQSIYKTASRMLPIREASDNVVLGLPQQPPARVRNTVTVMESLSEKGRSVRSLLQEQRRVALFDTFRIIEQLLFALQEVHHAGYLHLDIQDGNIFLKGSLSDNSQLLTLIDFGSARPMPNGKTAPIADRVIFTSEGFSAPEILLGNDGTLCLTPEADLYSVGCLALYLLTGHRPNLRTLMYNRSGKFLTQGQLSRLQCPRHLSDRLQAILSRALEQDPEKRYHSTEEMLADVSDLIGALRPYRTDLSSVKYDAFISYRHGETDSAAASVLQQQLESFRIPKDLRKERQSFRRVFVDEGELSSCADYGQQIRDALKNSGWLIVICSPETPASIWVQQEIDAFLENHDRSRILAVLTSGNPDTSFPPQLKADAEGNGEVLAADARGENAAEVIRRLKKDALLKIAAPMLGTTFDALKQRRKVQQMKRAISAAAVLLVTLVGFSAYAVNRARVIAAQAEQISAQAERIADEYQRALINESLLLSEQAEKQLKDNDPLNALELALAALPSEKQDRPVIPEAEAVLNQALNVYRTPLSAKDNAIVTGYIAEEADNFFIDESGKYVITFGLMDHVCRVWDADSLKLLHILDDGKPYFYPFLVPGTNLLIGKTGGEISCTDFVKNEKVWSVSAELTDFCVSDDGKTLMLLNHSFGDEKTELSLYSVETGKQIRSMECDTDIPYSSQKCIALSGDLKWGILSFGGSGELVLVNLEDMSICLLTQPASSNTFGFGYTFYGYLFTDNRLVLLWDDRTAGITKEHYTEINIIDGGKFLTECYDLNSGRRMWGRSCSCTSGSGRNSLAKIKDGKWRGYAVTFGNVFMLLDEKKGTILHQIDLPDGIMNLQFIDGGFLAVCANGSYIRHLYQSTGLIEYKVFDPGIYKAVSSADAVFIQKDRDNSKILKYEFGKYSDFYTALSVQDNWKAASQTGLSAEPDGILFWLYRENKLRVYDEGRQTDQVISVSDFANQYVDLNMLGTSSDGRYAYFWGNRDETLMMDRQILKTDLQSGTSEFLQTPGADPAKSLNGDVFLWEDRFWFVLKSSMGPVFALCSFAESDEEAQIVASIDAGQLSEHSDAIWNWRMTFHREQLDEENGRMIFCVEGACEQELHTVFVSVDLTTGTAQTIAAELPLLAVSERGQDIQCWNESQTAVCCVYGDTLYTFDQNGQPVSRITLDTEKEVKGIFLVQDERNILVVYADGRVDMHRVADGVKLSSCRLTDNMINNFSFVNIRALRLDAYRDNLILFTGSDGFVLRITDTEVKILAHIPEYVGYDALRDRLIVGAAQEIGAITPPPLAELIAYGEKFLSGGR